MIPLGARGRALAGACALALLPLRGAIEAGAPGGSRSAPAMPPSRTERTVPFAVGETLSYDVSWSSLLTAGTATVTVREKRPSYDSIAYYIVAEGRPTPLLSNLYDVYYKVDTLLDAFSLLSQRGSLFSQEGRHRRMAATRVDQARHRAEYEVTTATVVRKTFAVPPRVQDSLSAFYVMRSLPLGPGFETMMDVVDGDEVYRVRVVVGGRDAITTPAGQFTAWRITPLVSDARNQPKARGVVLWVSDDSRRLPVKLEAEMPVGRFVLILRHAGG